MNLLEQLNLVINNQDLINNESLIIHRAGRYDNAATHSIERNQESLMPEVIFIYCMEGEGWLTFENKTSLIKPGMGIICDKNTLHSYGSDINKAWTITWIHISGTFIQRVIYQLNIQNRCKAFETKDSFTIEHLMVKIIEHLEAPGLSIRRELVKTYIESIFNQLMFESLELETKELNTQRFFQRSIEYMNDNIYTQISLDDLCKYVNLSKYYFIRSFKKVTDTSPMAYFTLLKIQKACGLLMKDKLQIQDISEKLGFSTPYYFSETFKKVTGYSPKQYRKLMQMQH